MWSTGPVVRPTKCSPFTENGGRAIIEFAVKAPGALPVMMLLTAKRRSRVFIRAASTDPRRSIPHSADDGTMSDDVVRLATPSDGARSSVKPLSPLLPEDAPSRYR